ncbi:hypothetical protein LCGC14_1232870, partial [marine sediment metagenome]
MAENRLSGLIEAEKPINRLAGLTAEEEPTREEPARFDVPTVADPQDVPVATNNRLSGLLGEEPDTGIKVLPEQFSKEKFPHGVLVAAPEKTFWQKAKGFFVGEPRYGRWTKPQRLDYLHRAIGVPVSILTKYSSGRTFGADKLTWYVLSKIRPDLANKPLEEQIRELNPIEQSGFNRRLGDVAEFIGQVQSATKALGGLGLKTRTGTKFVDRVANKAPPWMSSGAIEAIVEGITREKDAKQIAKDVAVKSLIRGGEAIVWSGVEVGAGKLFGFAMNKFPRFRAGWQKWARGKPPEQARSARAEVDAALRIYKETGDRAAWDNVRIKYAGITPEGVQRIRAREGLLPAPIEKLRITTAEKNLSKALQKKANVSKTIADKAAEMVHRQGMSIAEVDKNFITPAVVLGEKAVMSAFEPPITELPSQVVTEAKKKLILDAQQEKAPTEVKDEKLLSERRDIKQIPQIQRKPQQIQRLNEIEDELVERHADEFSEIDISPKTRSAETKKVTEQITQHEIYQAELQGIEDIPDLSGRFSVSERDMAEIRSRFEGQTKILKKFTVEELADVGTRWDQAAAEIGIEDFDDFLDMVEIFVESGKAIRGGINEIALANALNSGDPSFDLFALKHDMLKKGFTAAEINKEINEFADREKIDRQFTDPELISLEDIKDVEKKQAILRELDKTLGKAKKEKITRTEQEAIAKARTIARQEKGPIFIIEKDGKFSITKKRPTKGKFTKVTPPARDELKGETERIDLTEKPTVAEPIGQEKISAEPATSTQKAKALIIAKGKAFVSEKGKLKPGYRALAKAMTGQTSIDRMTKQQASDFINALNKLPEPRMVKGRLVPPVIPTTTRLAVRGQFQRPFKEPTPISIITDPSFYANQLGVKSLVEPLEKAKQDFDFEYRNASNELDKQGVLIDKIGKTTAKERVLAKIKNVPTKAREEIGRLLDAHEIAPVDLAPEKARMFNYFRGLTRTMLQRQNEAREKLGWPTIPNRKAYMRRIATDISKEMLAGKYPFPEGVKFWSGINTGEKVFNPMEFRRKLEDDVFDLFVKDPVRASKAMMYTALKEIHLNQPLKFYKEQLNAIGKDLPEYRNLSPRERAELDKTVVMPAALRRWVNDYVNLNIKGNQHWKDERLNNLVTKTGLKGIFNTILTPFGRTIGRKPITDFFQLAGRAQMASVIGGRPKLIIRNKFQLTHNLAFSTLKANLRAFGPNNKELNSLLEQSRFLRDYTGLEDMPVDIAGKIEKLWHAGYQWSAKSNAKQSMEVAYWDTKELIDNPIYKKHGWKDEHLLKEMEFRASAAQFHYTALGMPQIFRNKRLLPMTRLTSWWMNYFSKFHREAIHRAFTG